mmetsp:Transcript_26689/g.60261  ORF Transcript_26689/g.60261 Transcript_26689/m.60261 type:complete len:80 (-) Transcript_26689:3-242(-)
MKFATAKRMRLLAHCKRRAALTTHFGPVPTQMAWVGRALLRKCRLGTTKLFADSGASWVRDLQHLPAWEVMTSPSIGRN